MFPPAGIIFNGGRVLRNTFSNQLNPYRTFVVFSKPYWLSQIKPIIFCERQAKNKKFNSHRTQIGAPRKAGQFLRNSLRSNKALCHGVWFCFLFSYTLKNVNGVILFKIYVIHFFLNRSIFAQLLSLKSCNASKSFLYSKNNVNLEYRMCYEFN